MGKSRYDGAKKRGVFLDFYTNVYYLFVQVISLSQLTLPKRKIMPPIAKDRIERAARIYASNHDAGSALGIAPGSFSRLCRRYGIETPQARKRRQRSEWKQDYLSLHNQKEQ